MKSANASAKAQIARAPARARERMLKQEGARGRLQTNGASANKVRKLERAPRESEPEQAGQAIERQLERE
eukprot:6172360-Pleurochrysis_carterae.AAC.1